MARQHTTPLLLPREGAARSLTPISATSGEDAVLEAEIQQLVHDFPTILPIQEIDPIFVGAIPVCREFPAGTGRIDNFLVTPSGLPILVECKLWRNAEARRKVVAQILEYAQELALLTASDVRREATRRADGDPDALLKLVRAADPTVDEQQFDDALSANLRRGRFLLLVVGEGIHEGVERIAEFLQQHAGLHFVFGLVELPFYRISDSERLVVPRVLAKTEVITRNVVAVPDGFTVAEPADAQEEAELDPETQALGDDRQQFWSEFLAGLDLDDREQPMPRPPRQGYVTFTLPAPAGTSWLTVYRDMRNNEVGVFLSSHRNSPGERAMETIAADWATVRPALGGTVRLETKANRPRIVDSRRAGPLTAPAEREAAFAWLRERTNTFVNVLRPLVRSAVAEGGD